MCHEVRLKIYTKTGDKGLTGLIGGVRIAKSAPRIAAYGDVDELNSVIGIVIAETSHEPIRKSLTEIQSTLFTIGAQLATPSDQPNVQVVTSSQVDLLERQMDVISESLQPLKNFVLPGGGKSSAYLHLARTVCRRAERSIVSLSQIPSEKIDKWVIIFMNRLSDYLFTLARLANQLDNIPDVPWVPHK